MRTLAGTAGTRQQAESTSERLRDLGIDPGAILIKPVDPIPGRSNNLDPSQERAKESAEPRFLITVKVRPEQLGAAKLILESDRRDTEAAVQPTADESPIERRNVARQEKQTRPKTQMPDYGPKDILRFALFAILIVAVGMGLGAALKTLTQG